MSPRAPLPGADELFRATASADGGDTAGPPISDPAGASGGLQDAQATARAVHSGGRGVRRSPQGADRDRTSSGRERHDEKITVYVSAGELVDLERARLTLRAEHGIAIDRGRIVREALAVVLADLEAKLGASILVTRLSDR